MQLLEMLSGYNSETHPTTEPSNMFTLNKEIFNRDVMVTQVNEWINILLKENEKIKGESNPTHQQLAMIEAAGFLFTICSKLEVNSASKFLALDIYQRFSVRHIQTVMKSISDREEMQTNPNDFLEKTQEKMGKQAPLRMITCLWISIKFTNHIRDISIEALQDILKECGAPVTSEILKKSELRVLGEIDFHVRSYNTLSEYIGVLVFFIEIAQDSASNINLKGDQVNILFNTSLQILEFIYLNYDDIYMELFHAVTGSRVILKNHMDAFCRVQSDRMLLASSIVATAGWKHGKLKLCSHFVMQFTSILHIPSKDIYRFTVCIIKHIFSRRNRNRRNQN